MNPTTTGPFGPEELVYRLGRGLVLVGYYSESFWCNAQQEDAGEGIPPYLNRRVSEVRYHLEELSRVSGGANPAQDYRDLLVTFERAWGVYESSWFGPDHARSIGARDRTDGEFGWAVMQESLPTNMPAWDGLREQLEPFLESLPEIQKFGFRLGMYRAALNLMHGDRLEWDRWPFDSRSIYPVNELGT